MTTTEIIKKRRAIYPAMYTNESIPDHVIQEVLELAAFAPTHRMTQPWKFKVFTGEGLKSLSSFLANYYKENTAAEKYSDRKYNKTLNKPLKSTHVVAIIMKRDPEESVPEWEEIAAVSMAVQNIWLALTEREIGCYWSSPKSITNDTEFLRLGPGERCLGLLYIGRPSVHPEMPPREDMKTRIEWIVS